MMLKNEILLRRVEERVREELSGAPGCHDYDHTERVVRNARKLARQELEESDAESYLAVSLAALLHDVARPEELRSEGRICHAQAGSGKSAKILRECGCEDETLIRLVSDAVRRHRYRGKDQPETLIDKLVYDADKLDSIGAVGIGRGVSLCGPGGGAAAQLRGGGACRKRVWTGGFRLPGVPGQTPSCAGADADGVRPRGGGGAVGVHARVFPPSVRRERRGVTPFCPVPFFCRKRTCKTPCDGVL